MLVTAKKPARASKHPPADEMGPGALGDGPRLHHIAPQAGPQTALLGCAAGEVLYGGAMGGGKTYGLVMAPLRWCHIADFRALILRRESTQFADILKKTHALYPAIFPGATFHANPKGEPPHWRFPSGARIYLSHCKDENDKYNFQGIEFQFIAYDELTHFTRSQFDEINNRLRGVVQGLPGHVRYIRCSANPGGQHAAWVKKYWAPWLDSRFEHPSLPKRYDSTGKRRPPALSGQVLWFKRNPLTGDEELVTQGTPGATSRTYIRSLIWDNPILMKEDPQYLDRLVNRNDPVRLQQIVYGDWEIQQGRGLFFPRKGWAGKILSSPPSKILVTIRCWDLACTADGDYAVGGKVSLCEGGEIWISDIKRQQGDPATIDKLVTTTAKKDKKKTAIVIEQEPGSGGKFTIYNFGRELHGYDIEPLIPDESKIDRARPFSAQFNLGNVYMQSGPWNEDLIDELHDFPEGDHDDQVDVLSGAYYVIADDEEGREAADETSNSKVRRRLRRALTAR